MNLEAVAAVVKHHHQKTVHLGRAGNLCSCGDEDGRESVCVRVSLRVCIPGPGPVAGPLEVGTGTLNVEIY